MKYYVIRVRIFNDGTEKKSEIMDYDERLRAIGKFHNNLGADMLDINIRSAMCCVINSRGQVEISEFFENSEPDQNVEVIEVPEINE